MSEVSTNDTAPSSRFALCVEYDGNAYKGWQTQKLPSVATVQEELEAALSKVANHPIKLICAGRTDTGVHASSQIVHFDSNSDRSEAAWLKGANSFLKGNISVRWAQKVDDEFHARFSAQSRRYRYVIYNNPIRPALMKGLVAWYYYPLDEVLMNSGAQYLLGKHDFTSYRGVACQSNTAIRTIKNIQVQRFGNYLVIDVTANAFLLHMIRNIVGVLLEIGEGRQKPEWVDEVLQLKDRTKASVTASPSGLYFVQVQYPEEFALPETEIGPEWLRGIGVS